MASRLSASTLNQITKAQRPNYHRGSVQCGIVHLGMGGFHRAHQAIYTDDLLADGDNRWGITGVSLRSSAIRDALAPQDFLYSVKTLGEPTAPARIIGSVLDTLVLQQENQRLRLLDLMASKSTQVVSLTITEKGYCAEHNGELDTYHPDITNDLNNPTAPVSAPGLLALGLRRRMEAGGGPISVVSCDNLSRNGRVTEQVVGDMARCLNPELAAWFSDHVSFPNTMVDRIVPQTQPADIANFEAESGYIDRALICGEPFSQWVIEDDFRGLRPAWDIAGAQFTSDVHLFEQAKLQLLNATHSALAYLGLLADHTYIHEAMSNSGLNQFVRRMLNDEISPEVKTPSGMDITDYKSSLLKRFANASVPYRTSQVAADGSKKLPQRIFPTIEARLSSGKPVRCLGLVVAAWIQCLTGLSTNGSAIALDDPAAPVLAKLAALNSSPVELVKAIAQDTDFFGALSAHPEFLKELSELLTELRQPSALFNLR